MTNIIKEYIIHKNNKAKQKCFHLWGVVCTGQYLFMVIYDSIVCGRSVSVRIYYFIITLEVLDIGTKELQINEEIRDKELRIIGDDGAQLGIMSAAQALDIAAEKNLDLVKIAPQATPPVCKIMDYGKYRFEQAKREKEARKNQHTVDIKEIKLSLNIDTHDFNTKLRNAQKFFAHGDKVKVSIRFRGREMGHAEYGYDTMQRFAEACQEVANIEKPAKLEGRQMLMFLAPKSGK